MQQEVNLWLLMPQQKKTFLTLRLMVTSYGLFVVLLALHFCLELWDKHRETVQLREMTQELSDVEQKLAQIHQQYPMLDPKDMESSLRTLQEELKEKNSVFNLLSAHRNFSGYLVGVAKAVTQDLWLVDIEAELGDQDLTLKGYALNSGAIQQFINNLALQTEFSGLNFQLQEVKKTELDKEIVLQFIISTKVASENST